MIGGEWRQMQKDAKDNEAQRVADGPKTGDKEHVVKEKVEPNKAVLAKETVQDSRSVPDLRNANHRGTSCNQPKMSSLVSF